METTKFTLKISSIGYEESRTLTTNESDNKSAFYIQLRTLDDYRGSFGFDWVDINPEGNIDCLQGTEIDNISDFIEKDSDDGFYTDFIKKNESHKSQIQNLIKEKYKSLKFDNKKIVDIPYSLIIKGESALLNVLTIFPNTTKFNKQTIYIESDEYYEFSFHYGFNDRNKKKEIQLKEHNNILVLNIECKKEHPQNKTYYIREKTNDSKGTKLGGICLMENKIKTLNFRVIALVSNSYNPTEKAKKILKDFNEDFIVQHLNYNSLNQAGYQIKIENQSVLDSINTVDIDNYFYAFDEEDWKSKGLFLESSRNIKLGIDEIIIDNYTKKLKRKNITPHNCGTIILCDYQSDDDNNPGAYSRAEPLDYYCLTVYKSHLHKSQTYSHEIGHMLGLHHTFYSDIEKSRYKVIKEKLYGNRVPRVLNNKKNEDYKPSIRELILRENPNDTPVRLKYEFDKISKKEALAFLRNFNNKYRNTVSFKVYLEENDKVILEIQAMKNTGYSKYKKKCTFIRSDHIKYLKAKEKYFKQVMNQKDNSFIKFNKGTTYNIMDYKNSDKSKPIYQRKYFSFYQIITMRGDKKNYEIIKCTYC